MQLVQAGCNTQFARIACHTTPAQGRSDMQFVQAECDTQFAQIACHTIPVQEMSDMQSVQTECHTQFAQIACHAIPAQEWCDMQSVQAECPNVDGLHVRGSLLNDLSGSDSKEAIRMRRDEASCHNDRSRSSIPRHASESKWTRVRVLVSICESCHCDCWPRLVSLLWLTWESEPARSRNMIFDYTASIQWSFMTAFPCMEMYACKAS